MNTQALTIQEQDAIFQAIVKKIPGITDPDRLSELVSQALELMLRRPQDQALKTELTRCVHDLFLGAKFVPPSSLTEATERRRARDCIELLQAAKEHRHPRDIIYPAQVRDVHRAHKERGHQHHAHYHAHHRPANANHIIGERTMKGVAVASMLMLGVGFSMWAYYHHANGEYVFDDAKIFTAEMIKAAETSESATSHFGGAIKVQFVDGHAEIVAQDVPAPVCAAAGWDLMHKGTLTVNGVTPKRVSPAIISELCHEAGDTVTVQWEPKERHTPVPTVPFHS